MLRPQAPCEAEGGCGRSSCIRVRQVSRIILQGCRCELWIKVARRERHDGPQIGARLHNRMHGHARIELRQCLPVLIGLPVHTLAVPHARAARRAAGGAPPQNRLKLHRDRQVHALLTQVRRLFGSLRLLVRRKGLAVHGQEGHRSGLLRPGQAMILRPLTPGHFRVAARIVAAAGVLVAARKTDAGRLVALCGKHSAACAALAWVDPAAGAGRVPDHVVTGDAARTRLGRAQLGHVHGGVSEPAKSVGHFGYCLSKPLRHLLGDLSYQVFALSLLILLPYAEGIKIDMVAT